MTVLIRSTRSTLSRSSRLAAAGSARPYSGATLTVGIRREDPERIWERRCPLTPDAVHELVHKERVRVLVQECDRRIFTMDDFVRAGAEVHPSLEPAHITVGIKETPVPELLTTPVPHTYKPGKDMARTHLMFSHTIKGQEYNMPLLSRFLAGSPASLGQDSDLLPQLIDYELLCGPDGKRTVGFGWFAGVAGAIESLSAMAHAHLELGVASPFLYTPRPHSHPSLPSLRQALRSVGEMVSQHGTPKSLGPMVIGVTGNGQVAKGVLQILEELPVVHINVEDLPSLVGDSSTSLNKIYLVHALPESYLSTESGKPYERVEYYANPSSYKSEFCSKVAPYLSLFINCAGWAPSFPRVMSNEQLATALHLAQSVGLGRMASIGDISCDIEGGLEFLPRASTLSSPFFKTRPPCLPEHLPEVQMMAVDILPTSIPYDASVHFSSVLMPYLRVLLRQYKGEKLQDDESLALEEALKNASIAKTGKLTDRHGWLRGSVDSWRKSAELAASGHPTSVLADTNLNVSNAENTPTVAGPDPAGHSAATFKPKRKVLLLGSGMVAGPAVTEIAGRQDVEILIASNSFSEAQNLARGHENASAVAIDMSDLTSVENLVGQADVVISLLPVTFHPSVAELCVKCRKHLVTASYISPAMRALDKNAQDADVLLLNEVGLDPGIDHCSAISLLSNLRGQGKEIVSFISFCGGLPAPECAEVPLGYKFSWSPKGVLLAALNGAKFRLGGKDRDIAEKDLLTSRFASVPVSTVLNFEGIANRDSYPYGPAYGLSTDIRTLLRGTLRYPGYCDLVQSFKLIGLLSTEPLTHPVSSWSDLVPRALGAKGIRVKDNDYASIRGVLLDIVGPHHGESLLDALQWFGLLPSSTARELPSISGASSTIIDHLATLLAHQLRYGPSERDLVVLSHEIIARPKDAAPGAAEEVYTSQLVTYGTPTASAMSRTVGLPVAIAALQVLDGKVSVRGVQGPTHREIYEGILTNLDKAGLSMKEGVRKGVSLESTLSGNLQYIS